MENLEKTADELQQVVIETTGTALTISPKDGKWSGYLLQKKKSFEEPSLAKLCTKMVAYIKDNREKSGDVSGKKSKKPYTLK